MIMQPWPDMNVHFAFLCKHNVLYLYTVMSSMVCDVSFQAPLSCDNITCLHVAKLDLLWYMKDDNKQAAQYNL